MVRVLMIGWEFPPFHSGGLGVACEGLVKSLLRRGADVLLVLPGPRPELSHERLTVKCMGSEAGNPYSKPFSFSGGSSIFERVKSFASYVASIAANGGFDVIHCHDWLTFPAGIAAKRVSSKPLVCHVHATEWDRTAGNPCPEIWKLEKAGMEEADLIIAVSNYTKRILCERYDISPERVRVIHNAIDTLPFKGADLCSPLKRKYKLVLFLGRVTVQKGPDHFLRIASSVSRFFSNVKFLVIGDGDMLPRIVEEAARMELGDKVLFTKRVERERVAEAYKLADVYVMPSVSEPFGLTALEAMAAGTPVVLSKQSGVIEVVRNCLVADFWDVEEMTNKIAALLKYEELREELRRNGQLEVERLSWDKAAERCFEVYRGLLS